MYSIFSYNTPIGEYHIAENGQAITELESGSLSMRPGYTHQETPLLRKAAAQLLEYMDGTRKEFDLPLAPQGTEFQRKVWDALCAIPYGETRSYAQIAAAVDNPKGCRAVGMANNKNPIAIVIPCHRVIGARGDLVGYAGGLDRKRALLELERTHV